MLAPLLLVILWAGTHTCIGLYLHALEYREKKVDYGMLYVNYMF